MISLPCMLWLSAAFVLTTPASIFNQPIALDDQNNLRFKVATYDPSHADLFLSTLPDHDQPIIRAIDRFSLRNHSEKKSLPTLVAMNHVAAIPASTGADLVSQLQQQNELRRMRLTMGHGNFEMPT